jgi:hypothetical protein
MQINKKTMKEKPTKRDTGWDSKRSPSLRACLNYDFNMILVINMIRCG